MPDQLTVIVVILCVTMIINSLIRSSDQRKWREKSDILAKAYNELTEQMKLLTEVLRNERES